MSDTSAPSSGPSAARPVSLLAVGFIFLLFAAALIMARYLYRPAAALPQDTAAENLGRDLQWRASAESRRAALAQLQEEQRKKAQSYGWVDQKAGVIQLPIERAMELTAQKYGARK